MATKSRTPARPRLESQVETKLRRYDRKTGDLVAGKEVAKDTGGPELLGPVYIGHVDTLSWSQQCHSYESCSPENMVDTETTIIVYHDQACRRTAGVFAIYNGGAVKDNSALVQTAMTAYLAKAPVWFWWKNVSEPYSRSHGRLRAVLRMWFHHCDPC